jgi:hypothetical protein
LLMAGEYVPVPTVLTKRLGKAAAEAVALKS